MRIVGGRFRGRRIPSPKGTQTRPTSERAREAMASALSARGCIEGSRVLDLFAGSGALGFEMLSRGAREVVFVEKDRRMADAIRHSAGLLGVSGEVQVLCQDALSARSQERIVASGPFDLVLSDPPYAAVEPAWLAVAAMVGRGLLAEDAVVLLEHSAKARPSLRGELSEVSSYRHGDTVMTLLRREGNRRMSIAIYPGSFDPMTNGHVSIIQGGLVAFDKIIVAVLQNPKKNALFSVQERIEMIREAFGDEQRVEVDSFDGLLVDYCRRRGARIVLRGLRAVADFEYELQMANMNRHLYESMETVFLMANDAYFYVSSNIVKEAASLGADVSALVPDSVSRRLKDKLGR